MLKLDDLPLWEHQRTAIDTCERYFAAGNDRAALVQLPTGTGKTGIMATLATRRAIEHPVIVVCPSTALAEQLQQEFSGRFWERIGADPAWAPEHVLRLLPSELDKLVEALDDKGDGKSFVVTTGTGSGKSLCFFIPIVDAVVKAKRSGETARTRAVVIYPMNALANSQLEELKKFLHQNHPVPVTFARYTGQEGPDERDRIKNNPPDILLTNFMMLELLMTRQSELDKAVIENCRGLKFIVLDELHTYRGRQGADVAMLMRRLRARVGDPDHPPICIGTSATMASEGVEEDRNQIVAGVASSLFGTPISRDAIVTETLRRATDPNRSADEGLQDLGPAVVRAADGSPYDGKSNAEIAQDALAIWVETRLGLKEVNRKPLRASPNSLKDAAKILSDDSAQGLDVCERALKNCLLAFSLPEKDRG